MYIKKVFFEKQINILQKQYKKETLYYQISIGILVLSFFMPFLIPIFIDFPSIESIMGGMTPDVYGINSGSGIPNTGTLNQVFGKMMIFFILSTILSIAGIVGMTKYKKKNRQENLKKQFKILLNNIPRISYPQFIKLLESNQVLGQHIEDKDNNSDHLIEPGYTYYSLKNGQVLYINNMENPREDNDINIQNKMKKLQVLPKLSYYLSS